jgi:hypothetical protein
MNPAYAECFSGGISISRGVADKDCLRVISKRVMFSIFAIMFWLVCGSSSAQAYTTEISTNTALEQQFLNATAQQFDVVIASNPFFSNTYTMQLLGNNTNYNPAPTMMDLLNDLVAVDTYTFVYGFADGMVYQQTSETNLVSGLESLCGSATSYNLVQTSTKTFDLGTCEDVTGTIIEQLYNMSTSTPTVIPPEP